MDEKSRIPKKEIKKFVRGTLDGYINYVYRSLKCSRDGNTLGARLNAALSINLFLDVAFALHGQRLRPYYKYLQWELEKFPLKKLSVTSKELLKNIRKILDSADIKTQQKMFISLEKACRKEGYGSVFDGWGDKLRWIKTYKL